MTTSAAHRLRISALETRAPTAFALRPEAEERARLAAALDLLGLSKVSLTGEIAPEGGDDWRLKARLGATVTQACVVTLAPVRTRIDAEVERLYSPRATRPEGAGEYEMPEDDTLEPVPEVLDLVALLEEALALALPDYPRSDAAEFAGAESRPPGAAPIEDAEVKPFASLAQLRDKLSSEGRD